MVHDPNFVDLRNLPPPQPIQTPLFDKISQSCMDAAQTAGDACVNFLAEKLDRLTNAIKSIEPKSVASMMPKLADRGGSGMDFQSPSAPSTPERGNSPKIERNVPERSKQPEIMASVSMADVGCFPSPNTPCATGHIQGHAR